MSQVASQTLERPVTPPLAKISDGAFKPVGGDKAHNAKKDKNVATTLDRAAGKALASKVIKATSNQRNQWLGYVQEAQALTNEGRVAVLADLQAYLDEQREQAKERGRTDDEKKAYTKDVRVWAVMLTNFRRIVEAMTACGLDVAMVADHAGKLDASTVTFADYRKAAGEFLKSHAEALAASKGKPGRPKRTAADKLKKYLEDHGAELASEAKECVAILTAAAKALKGEPAKAA
jgi:hypothetical protein